MRVLHITPWYPHADDPVRGLFIRRHIESMEGLCESHVIHLDMDGRKFPDPVSGKVTVIHVNTRISSWQWREWLFYRALRRQLHKLKAAEKFTHVNFHIAYPSLVYFGRLKKLLPARICLTEHWSIYHYNFFSLRQPHRLRSLFSHDLPVICVSKSLGDDIRNFSGRTPAITVIPNAIDNRYFRFENQPVGDHYLTAALWKSPKNPLPMLQAVASLRDQERPIVLKIAGHGPLIRRMKKFVDDNHLKDLVIFLGQMKPEDLAKEMNKACAFLLPSSYETFSVVTAESLCCGCPVIADAVGAINELLHARNGILRTPGESWEDLLSGFNPAVFDRASISDEAIGLYSKNNVGRQYVQFLQSL